MGSQAEVQTLVGRGWGCLRALPQSEVLALGHVGAKRYSPQSHSCPRSRCGCHGEGGCRGWTLWWELPASWPLGHVSLLFLSPEAALSTLAFPASQPISLPTRSLQARLPSEWPWRGSQTTARLPLPPLGGVSLWEPSPQRPLRPVVGEVALLSPGSPSHCVWNDLIDQRGRSALLAAGAWPQLAASPTGAQ